MIPKREQEQSKKDGPGEGQVVKKTNADQGRQPEEVEDTSDRVIHNGSAGAFEGSEDGHYEEDSDEDNDDFAMGH